MSLLEKKLSGDTAYRIKHRALEATAKVSHHISQNGASNQPYITDVEFVTANQTDESGITGHSTLTTGIEFKVVAPDGRVQNVRIEGPSWVDGHNRGFGLFGGLNLGDLGAVEERKMIEWAEEIEKVAPVFRTLADTEDIFLQGIPNWQNYGIKSSLLVMLWPPDPDPASTDIPWADLLPKGIVHVVAPWKIVQPNFVAGDRGMYDVCVAAKWVLERDEAVAWIQFNSDFTREEIVKDMSLSMAAVSEVPNFHFLTCQSAYEFTNQWLTLNRQFSPSLWVLYNAWEAPNIPPGHPGSEVRPEVWEETLGNMLFSGTVIAFNRIDPDKHPRDLPALKPWRLAEHEQSFMDSLWKMEWSGGGERHHVYIPAEHQYNRDVIADIIKRQTGLEVGLPNSGHVEVWKDKPDGTGAWCATIDMKAWRDNHGH